MIRHKLLLPLLAILATYTTSATAEDYVLDASKLSVGTIVNENLIIKQGCSNPNKTNCTEKLNWLTSTSATKVGSIDVVGGLTGEFEVVVTADFQYESKAISLFTSDDKTISLKFSGDGSARVSFSPNGVGSGGGLGGYGITGWNGGDAFNEVKIVVKNGLANAYSNGRVVVNTPIQFDKNTVFERVSIEGIKIDDRVSEVKVRGIQNITSTPTSSANGNTTTTSTSGSNTSTTTTSTSGSNTSITPIFSGITISGDCVAEYTADGQLHVPCVNAVGAFGLIGAYEIWLQQKPESFDFSLDVDRIQQK